ncbi:T9SS type A sorting domain-containing protein [candidate division WOR-3 bacterium]|nr:T9SS type A sorting domain-containing protein [candidate division WOR-3 bacterium]
MSNLILSILFLSSFLPDNYQGIHEMEWHKHKGELITAPTPEEVIPLWKGERPLRKVVFGYYPYWMGTSYNYLQYDLLSHIAYFSVTLNGDGSLGAIPNQSILENLRNAAHSNGVMVMITATQFNNAVIENLLNSASSRTNAINNLYNLTVTNSLDGVSIDFESPTNTVKDSLTLFMTELTSHFHTNLPGSHITIATPAVDWGNAFDYDELALNTDGLFIMAYNYYWSGSVYAGPVSPLPSSSLWGTYSVMWTVNNYIQYGIYRDKFIVGCPYYGLRWPTEDNNLKSLTRGTGSALTYSQAADSANIYMKLWDDTSKTVWYRNYISGDGWYQCWFDDSLSLRMKYQVVIDSNLCGAGIWALGYDGTKSELWGALKDAFYYTGIKERLSRKIKLSVYPNPFREKAVFSLQCPVPSDKKAITLHIYDLSGRLVKSFVINTNHSVLTTVVFWDGKDNEGKLLPSGIYFCTFISAVNKKTEKITLLK